jgi:hypothetical protein
MAFGISVQVDVREHNNNGEFDCSPAFFIYTNHGWATIPSASQTQPTGLSHNYGIVVGGFARIVAR